jgi:hypothetical protein
VDVSLTPRYLLTHRAWHAWSLLAGGLLLAGLLGAFMLVVTGRAVVVEELVGLRTAEIQKVNEDLKSQNQERRRAEEALRASLREKEVLLREIHHRVKNNLQVVSSMLHLQAWTAGNRDAASVLQDCENRVRSMGLIHELLYRDHDLATFDFAQYVRLLTDHLFRTYSADPRSVTLNVEMQHDVRLDLDTAIPCGLIINELVSNALKYAFSDGRKGVIRVGLDRKDDGTCTLTVSDDGHGLPEEIASGSSPSLGLQVVHALARQLGGALEREPAEKGACFVLRFRVADVEGRGDPA